MPALNYSLLLLIIGFNAVVYAACWQSLRAATERFFLGLLLVGLCFYSGVGTAYLPALWGYALHYGCFVVAAAASFVFAVSTARGIARRQTDVYRRIDRLGQNHLFQPVVLTTYLAACLVPLLYPEFRLSQLWHPPQPDLLAELNQGIAVEQPLLLRLNGYVLLLLSPFYFIALAGIRRRYFTLALCMAAPLYLQHCADGYVARSGMMMCLVLYVGVIWLDRPEFRPRITVVAVIGLPLLLVFLGAYSAMRLGAVSNGTVRSSDLIQGVLATETSFPRSWDTLVDSRRRANLGAYATWLLTLPVPKVLTGEIRGARINEEISGIVSGIYAGRGDFFITLTGPVVESAYIYGTTWFWIHACFIGALGGVACAFAGGCRSLLVVLVQFALLFGYVYNRAGISATVPVLLNSYLSLYLTVLVLWSLGGRRASSAARVAT